MNIFEYQGRAVAFDRCGSGTPMVFLHNGGSQRHIWDDQVAALRRDHEVFALDLPGYGESDQPADGHRLADYVRMFGAFLDAYRLSDVVLVGNCVGSATALSYAMDHPDRVRALVLINPLTWDTVSSGKSAGLAREAARLPLGALARRLALPGRAVSRIVGSQLGSRGRNQSLQNSPRLRAHWSDRGRLNSVYELVQDLPTYATLDRFDPPADFPPICTIWGKQNLVLSADAGARLNRVLRPRTAIELPDCGHLPMVEDPDRVTSIITEFLATTSRSTAPTVGGS
ncbi:alpha/beta hydrolase [Nocardia vulneris]|uniref:alpha/beta fold hydrolase n=1 Tax=Nocardia vulneris TaxID=1141657 RepID=UPI0030D23EDD